jgi:electron transfer flavoprotein alpha subunit
MDQIWTISEQYQGEIKRVSFELLARGRSLADQAGAFLVAMVFSDDAAGRTLGEDSLKELIFRGADEVVCIQGPGLSVFQCETWSKNLAVLARERKPSIIIAAATSSGRTLMPHLAVNLSAGLTADCTELSIEAETGNLLQTRPAIGGNIMATIKTPDHRPQMATVRPKSALPLAPDPQRLGSVARFSADPLLADSRVEVLGLESDIPDFENIEEAGIVVAGGRGLKKSDNFKVLRELADALGAAVGASREAVDRGWISYPHQVGLSGKTISPRLYICAGISGAIQHLAGIKTAETIVSINSDPDAPIHKLADFAIVGDLFDIVPRIVRRLAEKNPNHSNSTGGAR